MTLSSPSVLFVTQTAYPWGGVETWLGRLVPYLESTGWDVTVGLVRGKRFHSPEAYLERNPYRKTVDVPCLTATPEGRVRALTGAIREVDAAIVAPVNVGDVLEACGREAAAGRARRLLYTLHGLGGDYLDEAARYRQVITRAVTASRLAAALLTEASGLPKERVGHARYGADGPRREAVPRSGPLRVGFVGRLEEAQKRALDVSAVAKLLARSGVDIHLVVAGGGPLEGELNRELRAALPEPRLSWRGTLPTQRVHSEVYPELDVLLLTSSWETGPMVAWEAMLHGVPLVTSRFAGLRAEGLLRHEVNCLVAEVGDVEGLAGAVARLARDGELLARLAEAARALARSEMTWESCLPAWAAEFERCLAAPLPPGACPVSRSVPAGRLDRIFGPSVAETLRVLLGRRGRANEPGAEWPHSVGRSRDPFDAAGLAEIEARVAAGVR